MTKQEKLTIKKALDEIVQRYAAEHPGQCVADSRIGDQLRVLAKLAGYRTRQLQSSKNDETRD